MTRRAPRISTSNRFNRRHCKRWRLWPRKGKNSASAVTSPAPRTSTPNLFKRKLHFHKGSTSAATSREPRILASILKPRLTGCDKASTADIGLDKKLDLSRRHGKCRGYRLRAVLTGDNASAADLDFDLKPGLTGCAAASASDIDFEPF